MNQRWTDFGNTARLELYPCQITFRIPKTGKRDLKSDSDSTILSGASD